MQNTLSLRNKSWNSRSFWPIISKASVRRRRDNWSITWFIIIFDCRSFSLTHHDIFSSRSCFLRRTRSSPFKNLTRNLGRHLAFDFLRWPANLTNLILETWQRALILRRIGRTRLSCFPHISLRASILDLNRRSWLKQGFGSSVYWGFLRGFGPLTHLLKINVS